MPPSRQRKDLVFHGLNAQLHMPNAIPGQEIQTTVIH
jgi:hypothetical protein